MRPLGKLAARAVPLAIPIRRPSPARDAAARAVLVVGGVVGVDAAPQVGQRTEPDHAVPQERFESQGEGVMAQRVDAELHLVALRGPGVREVHHPGVVDQHVDGTELRLDHVEEGPKGVGIGYVESGDGGDAELISGLLGTGLVDVADGDAVAASDQFLGRLVTDTAGSAGDRDRLGGKECGASHLMCSWCRPRR